MYNFWLSSILCVNPYFHLESFFCTLKHFILTFSVVLVIFYCAQKIIYVIYISERFIAGFWNLNWQLSFLFPLSALNMLLHYVLACIVSDDKSQQYPLYLFLCEEHIFHTPSCFQDFLYIVGLINLIMVLLPWCSFLYCFHAGILLSFLFYAYPHKVIKGCCSFK